MYNRLLIVCLLLLSYRLAVAEVYVLPPPGVDIIGETRVAYSRYEDTLMDIARDHSLGYDEILLANPRVDRWIPGDGTPVTLPTRFILPDPPHQGMVLNLAERRLYYFPKPKKGEKPRVLTYPIGVGRMDWETPLGETKVVTKTKDPAWRPPQSIKREHLELYGETLPDVVPPGPENPLGPYALRLGIPGYLIHGTNKRDGVGSRVSHGCVRLYNEDITELFSQVPVGTKVRIINQPIKVGWFAGTLFIEIHAPLNDDQNAIYRPTVDDAMTVIREKLTVKNNGNGTGSYSDPSLLIDRRQLEAALEQASGLPVPLFN